MNFYSKPYSEIIPNFFQEKQMLLILSFSLMVWKFLKVDPPKTEEKLIKSSMLQDQLAESKLQMTPKIFDSKDLSFLFKLKNILMSPKLILSSPLNSPDDE